MNSKFKWVHVNDVIKMCQQTNNNDSYDMVSKEITSNAMHSGNVDVEQTFRSFTI